MGIFDLIQRTDNFPVLSDFTYPQIYVVSSKLNFHRESAFIFSAAHSEEHPGGESFFNGNSVVTELQHSVDPATMFNGKGD